MKKRGNAAESGHFHAVRFYENRQSLARIVAGFVGEGLDADVPAILIATAAHHQAIIEQLGAMSFDIDRLRGDGRLSVLDGEETLARVLVDDMPSPERCQEVFGPALDAAAGLTKHRAVRVYGELADLLWKRGMETAAVRLEMLGNQLGTDRKFSLLCGYSMGNFYENAGFKEICDQHTHVVSSAGAMAPLNIRT
jgi:hypothetical protein